MDPTAGTTVSLGTLGVASAGALSGSIYAFAKSQPASLMGFAAGINSGIAGLTFFALREYAISPALVLSLDSPQYARRRTQLGVSLPQFNDSKYGIMSPDDELRAIRQDRLLDTGISGAIAGAGLNFWRSGPRAIVPGAVTASVACTLLQVAANELAVQRIRYVAGTPVTIPVKSVPLSNSPPLPATSTSTPVTTPVASVVHQLVEANQPPKSTLQRIVETLSYVIPLTRLDDKEYLERLERKRDVLDEKITKLHDELSKNPPPRPT